MEGYRNSLVCLHILLKYFHVGSMQGYAIPWLAEDILLNISMWATWRAIQFLGLQRTLFSSISMAAAWRALAIPWLAKDIVCRY